MWPGKYANLLKVLSGVRAVYAFQMKRRIDFHSGKIEVGPDHLSGSKKRLDCAENWGIHENLGRRCTQFY